MTYRLDVTEAAEVHHNYNGNQQGDCWIVPVENGYDARIKFVNNRDVDGDHYSCDVVLRDENGTVTGAAQFKAGLNGIGFGGVNEREKTLHMPMTPEERAATRNADIEFGQFDERNDSEIWKAIGEFAKKVFELWKDQPRDPHEKDPIGRSAGRV